MNSIRHIFIYITILLVGVMLCVPLHAALAEDTPAPTATVTPSAAPSPSSTPALTPTITPTLAPVTHRDLLVILTGDTVIGRELTIRHADTGREYTTAIRMDTESEEFTALFEMIDVGYWELYIDGMALDPVTVNLSNAAPTALLLEVNVYIPITPTFPEDMRVTLRSGEHALITADAKPAAVYALIRPPEGFTMDENGELTTSEDLEDGEYTLRVLANNGYAPDGEGILLVNIISSSTKLKALTLRGADVDRELPIPFTPEGALYEVEVPEVMHGVFIRPQAMGNGTVRMYAYNREITADAPLTLYMGVTTVRLDITASDGQARRTAYIRFRRGTIRAAAQAPMDITPPRLYSGSVSKWLLRTSAYDESGKLTIKWQQRLDDAFIDIPGANGDFVPVTMPSGTSVLRVVVLDAYGNVRVSPPLTYESEGYGDEIDVYSVRWDAEAVAGGRANLKDEPSRYAVASARVYAGDTYALLGLCNGYAKIAKDARERYIQAFHLSISEDKPAIATAAHAARIYAAPCATAAALDTMERGERVRVLAFCGGYARVEVNGRTGYVRLGTLR